MAPQLHDAEAHALCGHLPAFIGGGETVCAYVPVGSEPGSAELIDSLLRRGVRVLLPVARHDAAGLPVPLQWGDYRPGGLVRGAVRIARARRAVAAADAIAAATVVLVPALAVDRAGVRLGRGAGFYDRSLPLAAPTARLVAVVRDDELVDRAARRTARRADDARADTRSRPGRRCALRLRHGNDRAHVAVLALEPVEC